MTADALTLPYAPGSPEALAAGWVRWAAAPGFLRSPIADMSGKRAGRNQPGDVWFLAGSYGGDPVVRSCTVRPGADLFLPAVNMWFVGMPPEAMERGHGEVTLDGYRQELRPVVTPEPFVVRGGFLNGVTRSRADVPVTVWGLWARVPAPAPGQHDLHVVGGDGYGFVVDVSYRLTVPAG